MYVIREAYKRWHFLATILPRRPNWLFTRIAKQSADPDFSRPSHDRPRLAKRE